MAKRGRPTRSDGDRYAGGLVAYLFVQRLCREKGWPIKTAQAAISHKHNSKYRAITEERAAELAAELGVSAQEIIDADHDTQRALSSKPRLRTIRADYEWFCQWWANVYPEKRDN